MRRFGFGFFVGMVILFIGASLAFDTLFAIHLPILRGAVALLLVAVGVRVILRGGWTERVEPSSGEAWLTDRHFAPDEPLARDARYDVVLGRGVIDLSRLPEPETDVTVTVDTVFGQSVVKVDPSVPYDVQASAAFGKVEVPQRRAADHAPHLHLKVNAVFGACQVQEV